MSLDLERENDRLESASPEERLAFAAEQFGQHLLFTSSFGAQSSVLLHLWSVVCPELPVVLIDTGFLFPETLVYRDALAKRLGLDVHVVMPELTRDAYVAKNGADIQKRDPDSCCAAIRAARAATSGSSRQTVISSASTPSPR